MNRIAKELRLFQSQCHDMRVLLITNMIYALVLPVIDVFVAAYVMRNSRDVGLVVTYQLAVYTGIPFTFLVNGFLLKHVAIKRLYSLGMLLSGISMAAMMSLGELHIGGVAVAGILMGMSFGFFGANRDYLALATTDDRNRNYYYGVETFFYTVTFVVIPAAIGWFIEETAARGWFGGERNHAYQIVTACVFAVTVTASVIVHTGTFANPPASRFLYWNYHPLWYRMQLLAVLKGLAQGYLVTAPAMLVMRLVGQEGTLGALQAVGGIVSACLLYVIGRVAQPRHRLLVFSTGLVLFAAGALSNAILFNAAGVFLFMLCLLLAKPLLDVAYFPIQMFVIDLLSKIEDRNQFAYIFSHEFGLYLGRFSGCGLFIVLAYRISDLFALKYALLIIATLQLFSVWVAQRLLKCSEALAPEVTQVPAS